MWLDAAAQFGIFLCESATRRTRAERERKEKESEERDAAHYEQGSICFNQFATIRRHVSIVAYNKSFLEND